MKIVGATKIFIPKAVIKEDDFADVKLKIKKQGKIEGKNLYGFFVTKEEFVKKLAAIFCKDGLYEVPILQYEKGELIILGGGTSSEKPSLEFLKKISEGAFVVQSKTNVIKKLIEAGVPIRKIRVWHRLGCSFKN